MQPAPPRALAAVSTCGQDGDTCESQGWRPHPQPLSADTQRREAKPLRLSGPSLSCWGKGLQALSGAGAFSLNTPRRTHGGGCSTPAMGCALQKGPPPHSRPLSLISVLTRSHVVGGCDHSAPPVTWWRLCPPRPQPWHLTSLSLPPTHLAQPQADHMPSTMSAAPMPQPERGVSPHQHRPW